MRPLSEYIDELRSLDQNNIGSWPTWAYGLAISVVSLVIMLIAAWYFVLPKRDALADARHQESQLKESFRVKQAMVANLGAYRDQLATMQTEFGNLLAQLPSKTEVPSLLRDVSQTRSANGLDEELFKPEPEVTKDFYAVLPNDLIVTGDFHHFATFVSDVAALPRIVTISNVHIRPVGKSSRHAAQSEQGKGPLRMSLTASTYRYLGDTTGTQDHGKDGKGKS
ncbi:type 4a pilus biogenesis protein PilO [Salinisphaera sp. LB1]|uniref:type 4a pilus biogenesis protein PilO n=1 Tax=Salinisphaera sp. LB1 TaxID=2183911 RepID=UPI000D707902|nr:type 4a pilus biogenesis protein PilO [Salinisphaera sp. LB1]AWN14666.1 Type IV pilus biogenesis protein PilO [Salinisphaera sp. LB1]